MSCMSTGPAPRRRWPAFSLRTLFVLVTVSCVYFASRGCQIGSFGGDVRSVARRVGCTANLHALYDALAKYISVHGDVPRGKDGKASLDPLEDPN